MSDRFLLRPNCSICGADLGKNDVPLMLAIGDVINMTCPKCKTVWRFWLQIVTNQKKVGERKKKLS